MKFNFLVVVDEVGRAKERGGAGIVHRVKRARVYVGSLTLVTACGFDTDLCDVYEGHGDVPEAWCPACHELESFRSTCACGITHATAMDAVNCPIGGAFAPKEHS